MRKVTCVIIALTVLLVASCRKNNSGAAVTWSFEGYNYSGSTCTGSPTAGTLTAVSANTAATLTVTLDPYPTTAGPTTYTVVSGVPTSSDQAGISLVNGNGTFVSTGAVGSTVAQTVNVTVSGGKVSVGGGDLELINTANSDSSSLQLVITQTQ